MPSRSIRKLLTSKPVIIVNIIKWSTNFVVVWHMMIYTWRRFKSMFETWIININKDDKRFEDSNNPIAFTGTKFTDNHYCSSISSINQIIFQRLRIDNLTPSGLYNVSTSIVSTSIWRPQRWNKTLSQHENNILS